MTANPQFRSELLDPETLVEPTRFQMALARVEQARERSGEVFQHFARLLIGVDRDLMPVRLRVAEVFHHLRSALDHCGCELRDRYSSTPAKKNGEKHGVYLPIAGFKYKTTAEFLPTLRKRLPGLPPTFEQKLDQFQHYHGPDNVWLAEFAELSNEDKHERLCVQCVDQTACESHWQPELVDGRRVLVIRTDSPGWLGSKPRGLIVRRPSAGVSAGAAYRLLFEATEEEVDTYLKRACEGVAHIIETLRPDIS